MEPVQEQIQRIENKVQQLLKEYETAQQEIHRLQKENSSLMSELQLQTDQANQLRQRIETQGHSSADLKEKEKKDLEKRINTYLKDIDKCLALLHS